jgi:transcriptional regulator with XRE-family HTH domain
MIEQGKSSPTMTSLEKIARALSTPVSELVREDAVTQ